LSVFLASGLMLPAFIPRKAMIFAFLLPAIEVGGHRHGGAHQRRVAYDRVTMSFTPVMYWAVFVGSAIGTV
jgi:hypothetical protein